MDGNTLLEQRKWIQGPDFLWEEEEKWPQQPLALGETVNDDPEVQKVLNVSVVSVDDSMALVNKLRLVSFKESCGHNTSSS